MESAPPRQPRSEEFRLAADSDPRQNRPVKIEHFALQVSEPVAIANWYAQHLSFSIARAGGEPTHQRFLCDDSGAVMVEFYNNPRVPVPDYRRQDPLLVHLALVSMDPAGDRDRLVKAGAQLVEDVTRAGNGDELVMLRDPWGLALQLARRVEPMLTQAKS